MVVHLQLNVGRMEEFCRDFSLASNFIPIDANFLGRGEVSTEKDLGKLIPACWNPVVK